MAQANYNPATLPMLWGERFITAWRTPSIQTATSIVGTGFLALNITRLAQYTWRNFLRPGRLQIYCHAQTGSWALVTGASDGIGLAFTEELLSRGFHVLMHGRNGAKLGQARDRLTTKFPGRKVQIVIADASSLDTPEQLVADAVEKLPGKLTILINNVGGLDLDAEFTTLSRTTAEEVDKVMHLNVRFGTHLTRLLLPTLEANSPALVLNSSSLAGAIGMGFLTIYSASKGFVNILTHALRNEAYSEKTGVEVTTALIGNTISNGNRKMVPFTTITARECARGCLDRVGYDNAFIIPSWRHAIPLLIINMLPEKVGYDMTAKEMKSRNVENAKAK